MANGPGPARPRIPAALCLDTEDIIALASDDAALWMARELSDCGLRATFFVMGELARLWERRGRRDVIDALGRHEIGFHSTWHSVHPATTEVCLGLDARAGVEALRGREQAGWEDAERILQRPLAGWARTGGSWAPSVMTLTAGLGRCYAYSPVRLPTDNVCWYGGCLGFYGEGISGFDAVYADADAFAEKLEQADRQIDAYARSERRGAEWLCIFLGHPTRAIHTAFWDMIFAEGANPPREAWRPPVALPAERIPTVKASFRRLCEWLRDDERLEIVGISELARRYSGQTPGATHEEVIGIARCVAVERSVLLTEQFTAAEILLLMCRALAEPAQRYPRVSALGPLASPPRTRPVAFDASAVRSAAASLARTADGDYLPASVELAGAPVGIGAFFVMAARALAGDPRTADDGTLAWPVEAEAVAAEVERTIRDWPIHPPDMDLTNLLEQTRLQCWSLKPASA